MKAIDFVGANMLMNPPEGVGGKDCGTLPVAARRNNVFGETYESMWKPTAEELAFLNDGGHVCLICAGTQPPVMVSAAIGVIEKPPAVAGSGGGEASGGGLA